MDWIEKFPA
jgi:hypothetical protein